MKLFQVLGSHIETAFAVRYGECELIDYHFSKYAIAYIIANEIESMEIKNCRMNK